jgi:hypothetical protein
MTRIGANDPCPCESGLKYKRCCRDWHERARSASRRVFRSAAEMSAADERLDELSNAVNDLRRVGKLDEAERACADLMRECPDIDDPWWRMAQIREDRGDLAGALDAWRKVRAFHRTCPEVFVPDPSWIVETDGHIERLERAITGA